MTKIQFIQITPQQLADLISDNVRENLEELKRELINQKANDELLTRTEACEFLSIDSSTLWSWTNQGRIKAYGISNRRYYYRSELIESLKQVKSLKGYSNEKI